MKIRHTSDLGGLLSKKSRNLERRESKTWKLEKKFQKTLKITTWDKPQESVDTFLEKESQKRKPTWEQEIICEVESYVAPEGIHRERKREKTYNSYVALLCDIIDKEPSTYEEATKNKEWKDEMIEEYQSILKNDVWEIVMIP